jgi:hypothetical protein
MMFQLMLRLRYNLALSSASGISHMQQADGPESWLAVPLAPRDKSP